MGRKEKLKARLDLLPRDFTWDELVTLLRMYGFRVLNGKGSRRKFHNDVLGKVVSFHEPHPDNIVKRYVLEEVKGLLEVIGERE